jgi:hypothetical protein
MPDRRVTVRVRPRSRYWSQNLRIPDDSYFGCTVPAAQGGGFSPPELGGEKGVGVVA